MSIELVEKFLPYVDEQFSTESKKAMVTNQDFDWEGAHSVREIGRASCRERV